MRQCMPRWQQAGPAFLSSLSRPVVGKVMEVLLVVEMMEVGGSISDACGLFSATSWNINDYVTKLNAQRSSATYSIDVGILLISPASNPPH